MLSNYPPNVTGNEPIFGDKIRTISFTITFPYEIYNEDNEDIVQVIKNYIEIDDIIVDTTTIEHNIDDSYTVMLIYSDDIEMDMTYIEDYCDIEEEIIKYINELVLDARLDYRDDRIDIDYEVHR